MIHSTVIAARLSGHRMGAAQPALRFGGRRLSGATRMSLPVALALAYRSLEDDHLRLIELALAFWLTADGIAKLYGAGQTPRSSTRLALTMVSRSDRSHSDF